MRSFLNLFQYSRFASEYDQNQTIIPDVNEEKKHRVVAKLKTIVSNGDKLNNQRKFDKSL